MRRKRYRDRVSPRSSTDFAKSVLTAVSNIPRGMVMSYGEVASIVHSHRGARAVGNVLMNNFDPSVPCHRVIRADGTCGEYNRGRAIKRNLLRKEGVTCA
jgi:O-6-methylguanine DNA methyltransferase